MEKIALFVDVQNIYYTTRDAYGRSFNYRKFWKWACTQGDIVLANAYAIRRDEDSQIKFQDALRHIGFNLKLKPYIQRKDGTAKGDWDVGITIDVMQNAGNADRIILLSGDGDFDILLKTIRQQHGVSAEVCSVKELTARSLINAATKHHPIRPDMLL